MFVVSSRFFGFTIKVRLVGVVIMGVFNIDFYIMSKRKWNGLSILFILKRNCNIIH